MKNLCLSFVSCCLFSLLLNAQGNRQVKFKEHVPSDSIILSDPFILADQKTNMYYMTGTGGRLWKSKDLRFWDGPYDVIQTDPNSWMGPAPMVWAAEIHFYKNKYYYFATFTNRAVIIDTVKGNKIERRACHVLVSDKPDGPYVPMKDPIYLPADKPTLDGTFWIDKDGKPYMVYCYEWLQNWNGTIEKIELKPDLSGTVGIGTVLFRASDSPWSAAAERGRRALLRFRCLLRGSKRRCRKASVRATEATNKNAVGGSATELHNCHCQCRSARSAFGRAGCRGNDRR